MAGLVGTTRLGDLAPVAAGEGAAEGGPRLVYTWAGPVGNTLSRVRSYLPSGGGAPRLVADVGPYTKLGVWDTATGAFLGALRGPDESSVCTLVTYQRASDGRPRIAVGTDRGRLCIWDGDDLQVFHYIEVSSSPVGGMMGTVAVFEDPTSGRIRLVTT
jgi:hypothetical protein